MEKLATVQVALMEPLKERMEIERQKEERERLVLEKDTLCRACEMYSRLGMMDKVAELMKKIDLMTQTPVSTVVPVKVVETFATWENLFQNLLFRVLITVTCLN
jgi:hypothetical protein